MTAAVLHVALAERGSAKESHPPPNRGIGLLVGEVTHPLADRVSLPTCVNAVYSAAHT